VLSDQAIVRFMPSRARSLAIPGPRWLFQRSFDTVAGAIGTAQPAAHTFSIAARAASVDSGFPAVTLLSMNVAPHTLNPLGGFSGSLREELVHDPVRTKQTQPWRVIWIVGGAVWLGISCLSLVWMSRWSGTRFEGEWVLTQTGLAVKHLAVFLAAAMCYRAVIAMGWPAELGARVRALFVNVLLVLGLLWWSEVVEALVLGYVDGQLADMKIGFHSLFEFLFRLHWFATLMRSYFVPYALGLCAIVLTLVIKRRHSEAVQSAELARAYATTRMALLSAQLQPHFLFNSLNALTELIDEDPARASAMVVRLGNFLRHALESGRVPWVMLATEVAGLETYLDIQRVRFGDAIRLSVEVSPDALDIQVPSLILQPLVENAIEHGRRKSGPPLEIKIAISPKAEQLLIGVWNSRPRISARLLPQAYGHGLSNVELRLRAAYGDVAHLSIYPEGSGTLAALTLPLRR
jgi:hypothetical protein